MTRPESETEAAVPVLADEPEELDEDDGELYEPDEEEDEYDGDEYDDDDPEECDE